MNLQQYADQILNPFVNNYINKHKDKWIKEALEGIEQWKLYNPLWFWAE